jgi:hypothetical protein
MGEGTRYEQPLSTGFSQAIVLDIDAESLTFQLWYSNR